VWWIIAQGICQISERAIVYSIFVSSTSDELAEYRSRARHAILAHNFRPLAIEYFPAKSGPTTDVLRRYLDAADGVLLIVGSQYGSLIEGRSRVEWEFDEALKRRLPVVCLVLSEVDRTRDRSLTKEERDKQERFIKRLKEYAKVASFNNTNFDREIGAALTRFPEQFREGAGLIRLTDYNNSIELASSRLLKLAAHWTVLRLLSVSNLIRANIEFSNEGDSSMNRGGGSQQESGADDERMISEKVVDLIYDKQLVELSVATQITGRLLSRTLGRLHGFIEPSGFVPDSLGELEIVVDELFRETLSSLKTISIHSNDPAFVTYKGYWHDRELGPFFRRQNSEFLSRHGTGRLLRVFACDSVAGSVAEPWFSDTVIAQLRDGASVKVVQIDKGALSNYEDYGIYEHGSGAGGTYLLLALRHPNLQQCALTTALIVDRAVVADYSRKFQTLWRQHGEPLELLQSEELNSADHQDLSCRGTGRIGDLFGRRIILRRMERLDTGEQLFGSATHFARKYQFAYAQVLSDHIGFHFPDVRCLLYIGNTHQNDGTLIRNLQQLGWDVSGFICEPGLGIQRLWFDNLLYTDRWTDLVGLAQKVETKVGRNMLALFDIDKTLWAPSGVHDLPLNKSRIRAMCRLVDEYVSNSDRAVARHARARVEWLYGEISTMQYLPLTLDNEDFKATICVFLALCVVLNRRRFENVDHETGPAFLEELGQLPPRDFLKSVRDYVLSFANPMHGDEENITDFIEDTLLAVDSHQYLRYAKKNGILYEKMIEDLRGISRETIGTSPVQYPAFRAKELEESLVCAAENRDFDERLVLNKPAWDLAVWLRHRGVYLLALSDRPEEATVSPSGESLLDASMTIYGKEITSFLPNSSN
jgi:hypothetical protein